MGIKVRPMSQPTKSLASGSPSGTVLSGVSMVVDTIETNIRELWTPIG